MCQTENKPRLGEESPYWRVISGAGPLLRKGGPLTAEPSPGRAGTSVGEGALPPGRWPVSPLLQTSSPRPAPRPSSREQSCRVFFSTPSLSYQEQENTAQTFFQNKRTSYQRLRASSSIRRGPQPPRNARGRRGHSEKQGSAHCGSLRVTASGPGLQRSAAARTRSSSSCPVLSCPARPGPATPRHHAASLLSPQRSLGMGSTSPSACCRGCP